MLKRYGGIYFKPGNMKKNPLCVCHCRLQDEIAQREEAESNMHSFRQVEYDPPP